MSFTPRFKIYLPADLYESGEPEPIYTFPVVQETNAPRSERKVVEHEGQRAEGSIILDGGKSSWDLNINGVFVSQEPRGADAYKDIITKIDEMETALEINKPLILRIDKTEISYYQHNIKRLRSIEYPRSLRINSQEYRVSLRVNSW